MMHLLERARAAATQFLAGLRKWRKQAPVPACDVLLFITTEDEETSLRAVTATARIPFAGRTDARLGNYFDLGMVGPHRVLAVRLHVGATAHGGSASKAVLFQAATRARGLILLGMAFGVSPTEQERGDVLVSRSIFPYDYREMVDSPNGPVANYSRTKRRRAHPGLVAMMEREYKRAPHPFRVTFGALLSGGARVSSARFRDELVKGVPAGVDPVIGGDLEAVGLLAVTPADRPLWVVVKAIADFAQWPVAQTNPGIRASACRNAAELAVAALQNDVFEACSR